MPIAVVTGASRGFGRAIAHALAAREWSLVLDARNGEALAAAAAGLPPARTRAIAGDVTDPEHRQALLRAARGLGGVDLLINNASELGPSPQPELSAYPAAALTRVYETNVFAPLALAQLLLPGLTERAGILVNISSDAAVEAYPGWGGYGSAKAALDHMSAVLAVERTAVRTYAFDPGDMRTQMHQRAFPGEDISDRPDPETVVPGLLRLLEERPKSGRYRATDLLVAETIS